MLLRSVLNRPVSVIIATLTLIVIGFFSLLRLPVSLLPTLERPRLVVTLRDDDRSREELLRQVVEPLERRFLSLRGVVEVTSAVADARARLTLDTEWQTDVDRLRIEAERRLGDLAGLGLDEHEITSLAGDRRPILEIAVLGAKSRHDRTTFAEEVLLPELGRLRGAGRLERLGGAFRRPVVRPHTAALAARGLTAEDVAERLRAVGHSRPLGRLRNAGRVQPMIFREPVRSLAELRALRLGTAHLGAGEEPDRALGETTLGATLGDVAAVTLKEVEDPSHFRWNGEDAVLVELHRAPGANAVLLAREARQAVRRLTERLGPASAGPGSPGDGGALRLELIRDSSGEVIEALLQLAYAGALGLILGTLVLRFMLGSWRPTMALIAVVPASLITAFGGFYLWGVSLDVVSLAGLALAAGMLVDNSIVVLDAIERSRARGARDAAFEGSRQIALALVASFVTTAVVFLPLIYLRGLARAFFGVQAFAIITALAVSLVLSLSLTPILSRRGGAPGQATAGRSPGLRLYLGLLAGALRHPLRVIAPACLLLAAGAALLPGLPRELVPRGASRVLQVDYRLPADLERDALTARATAVEERLTRAAGAPRSVVSLYRGDTARSTLDGAFRGRLELVYDRPESLELARQAILRALGGLPGVEGEVRLRRGAVAAALERTRSRLEMVASAATPARAERLASRLVDLFDQRTAAAPRVIPSGQGGDAEPRSAFVLRWNAFRFARLGADPETVSRQVRAALGGFVAGRVEIEGAEREILVETTRPADPRLLPVRPASASTGRRNGGEGGGNVERGALSSEVLPLTALATIERRRDDPAFERFNARPSVRLAFDAGEISHERLDQVLDGWQLAVDEDVRLVGQAHELRRSFAQLRWALALALVLIFLVVAALYESLAMPLVVMTTVPVAAVGALGGLAVSGQSLNVMSFLGLLLLAGLVVNNAIVLVHRIEQRRAAGLDSSAAIRSAAEERYRPILMTTLTTLLGMIPLAALGGEGVELRRALATAVAGGLLTALFGALFVVPVLHRSILSSVRDAGRRSKGR